MTNEALQYKKRKTANEDVLSTLLKLVKEDQLTLDDVKHLVLVKFVFPPKFCNCIAAVKSSLFTFTRAMAI